LLYEVLDNGIEVAIKEDFQSKAVSIQCWVKSGSLHETDRERGMAHFIEHMLFKGTEKRGVGEIGKEVEACGGDINAYTTFDRTVFYLTLMSKYGELGVDLLSDAIFNSTFDPKELEAEKGVVLEEIKRGLDDPGSKVGREIFKNCFSGTEAGRPVIGDSESVKSFTQASVKEFHKKWYQPQNISIVAVGNFCQKEMYAWIKKYFGGSIGPSIPEIVWPESNFPKKTTVSLIKDDYNLPKLEIVFPAPSMSDKDMVALDIVSFILGTGSGSRLNKNVREKAKVVVACGASSYTPVFEGIFAVSAYANEDLYLDAVTELAKEMADLKSTNPITSSELERAITNLQSDKYYRDETVEGQARSIGYSLLTSQKVFYEDTYDAIVEKMTPELINGAIERWFDLERALIVGLLPAECKITQEQILKAYEKGISSYAEKDKTDLNLLRISENTGKNEELEEDIKTSQISESIKLVYRKIEGCKLFALTAATEGGSRCEASEKSGEQSAISHLLTLATEKHSYDEIVSKVEGLGASLTGFSGKDSLGMTLHCLDKDAKELGNLMIDCLINPVFPNDHWQLHQNELKETFASQNDSPSAICLRNFQEKLFADHPYGKPSYGSEKSTADFSAESLVKKFKNYAAEGPWVFSAVGSMEHGDVLSWLKSELKLFTPNASARKFPSKNVIPSLSPQGMKYFPKDREQSHIAFGYLGIDWFDKDRAALDVLINILGGHGGRLFLNLREKQSLAYTVAPVVSYGCDRGIVASYIACAPEKQQQALDAMKKEFIDLKENLVSQEELDRAINYIVGSHEMGLQKTDSQAMTMSLMEVYGIGFDDYKVYPRKVEKITTLDVKKVAARLFEGEGYTVVVGPNEI